jgi:hypothetical protein
MSGPSAAQFKVASVVGSITAHSALSRVRRPIAHGYPTLKPRVGSQSQSCGISSLPLKAPIISMSGLSLRKRCATASSASCGSWNSRMGTMTWPPPERWDPREAFIDDWVDAKCSIGKTCGEIREDLARALARLTYLARPATDRPWQSAILSALSEALKFEMNASWPRLIWRFSPLRSGSQRQKVRKLCAKIRQHLGSPKQYTERELPGGPHGHLCRWKNQNILTKSLADWMFAQQAKDPSEKAASQGGS